MQITRHLATETAGAWRSHHGIPSDSGGPGHHEPNNPGAIILRCERETRDHEHQRQAHGRHTVREVLPSA